MSAWQCHYKEYLANNNDNISSVPFTIEFNVKRKNLALLFGEF